MIALKRRERMIRRGVDLEQINLLLRVGNEESELTPNNKPSGVRLTKSKTSVEKINKKRRDKDVKTGTYATQPVSFISRGNMDPEPVVTTATVDEPKPKDQTAGSSSYGAFEMHTTGFGSRIMAKVGYVDGGGLGKDGRGISEPIQVIQCSRGKYGNERLGSKMMGKMGYVEGMGLGRGSQGMVDPIVASRLPKSRGLGAKDHRRILHRQVVVHNSFLSFISPTTNPCRKPSQQQRGKGQFFPQIQFDSTPIILRSDENESFRKTQDLRFVDLLDLSIGSWILPPW
ncbi:hypothetical protein L1887_03007 [Cichorium endivia]|nr:hypothetical protein L1887_03007 [Cichorium endivia]